jgi:hypothetical protein
MSDPPPLWWTPPIPLSEMRVYEAVEAEDETAAFRELERACVDLYLFDDVRPSKVILKVFREEGKEPVLRRWVIQSIDALDRCPATDETDQAREHLYLADGVIDLAGLLDFGGTAGENDRGKIVASLGKILSRHEEWRRCAGRVARAYDFQDWVDPATTAAESLHKLSSHPLAEEEIRKQVEAIARMGDVYPIPMRDHFMYWVLCHFCDRWMEREGTLALDEQAWPRNIGFVFGHVVTQWMVRHPFLLEYACHHLRERSGARWQDVAASLFAHARDQLELPERDRLRELLGLERADPPAPDLERLLQRLAGRQPFSVTVQSGMGSSPGDWAKAVG